MSKVNPLDSYAVLTAFEARDWSTLDEIIDSSDVYPLVLILAGFACDRMHELHRSGVSGPVTEQIQEKALACTRKKLAREAAT